MLCSRGICSMFSISRCCTSTSVILTNAFCWLAHLYGHAKKSWYEEQILSWIFVFTTVCTCSVLFRVCSHVIQVGSEKRLGFSHLAVPVVRCLVHVDVLYRWGVTRGWGFHTWLYLFSACWCVIQVRSDKRSKFSHLVVPIVRCLVRVDVLYRWGVTRGWGLHTWTSCQLLLWWQRCWSGCLRCVTTSRAQTLSSRSVCFIKGTIFLKP